MQPRDKILARAGAFTGTAGTAIAASSISATLSGAASGRRRHDHLHRVRPAPLAPVRLRQRRYHSGHRGRVRPGTCNPSAGFTPGSAGTYWWHGSYGGDPANLGSDSGCGTGMTSTVVTSPADLSLTNTGFPSPVISGHQLTYTLKAINTGGQAAANVNVTDPLPASAVFGSMHTTQGSWKRTVSAPNTNKDGTVTCRLGTLARGATTKVTTEVTPTKPGTLTGTATPTATNVRKDTDDTATATVTVYRT